jgi:hypothetical protein
MSPTTPARRPPSRWRGIREAAGEVLDSIHWLVGSVDQLVEEVQGWREDYGISYVSVVEDYRDAFAPVVARLAGR